MTELGDHGGQRPGNDDQQLVTGDLVVLPGMGHFELAMPTTPAWRPIAAEIRTLLESP